MDVFHVVIDTSMLRRAHFRHPNFERLLVRSQMGALKIYIPHIALEELRTQLLDQHVQLVEEIQARFDKLRRGSRDMLIDGLPLPVLSLWPPGDVARNSIEVFSRFLEENKIEVIPLSIEQAADAWRLYFEVAPPFDAAEERENRRKDIPDSWIFAAARGIKAKQGRHCALVADGKLKRALAEAGFEIYDNIERLDEAVETSTAVTFGERAHEIGPIRLDQLRSAAFQDIDVIVLGVNEALGNPSKAALFSVLERAGVDRAIAEHEARTLVLSGRLADTGSHLLPTNQDLAVQAMRTDVVTDLLLKII
ncbi:PIN domain-containing protein [uncultured Xanthomonas sp.]|uniref:PIN domain-containing protein n=1 Tax=uncultured Xanthomonas sp. TaxID=152831 RepID=UPI0025F37345|nr:PIN domain-containing protein [uncultured Xanthomonas sp.]